MLFTAFSLAISLIPRSWQQPLQKSKAGEGKRPRNVEDYLTGVLREVDGVKTTSTSAQGGLDENSVKMAVFERRKCPSPNPAN